MGFGSFLKNFVAPDPLNIWGENTEEINEFNDPLGLLSDTAQQPGKDFAGDVAGIEATPEVSAPTPAPTAPTPQNASQVRQKNARTKNKRRGRQATILSLNNDDPLGG